MYILSWLVLYMCFSCWWVHVSVIDAKRGEYLAYANIGTQFSFSILSINYSVITNFPTTIIPPSKYAFPFRLWLWNHSIILFVITPMYRNDWAFSKAHFSYTLFALKIWCCFNGSRMSSSSILCKSFGSRAWNRPTKRYCRIFRSTHSSTQTLTSLICYADSEFWELTNLSLYSTA